MLNIMYNYVSYFDDIKPNTTGTAAMSTRKSLHAVRDLMDRHFAEALSVDDLAEYAHLSRYHFIRVFRREFFETPHQYLTRRRIAQAKELLANSQRTITEICFDVGFSSVGSFSTLFHRAVGWSPSIYRARVWAQRQNPYRFIPGCYCTVYGLYEAKQSSE